MRCIHSYLKMPNDHLINMYKEKIRKIREAQDAAKNVRIVKGKPLLTHISENKSLQDAISNGTSACAIDFVGKNK